MSRHERRIYFDRLCELREWYLVADDDDRSSVLSLSGVERFVEATWAAAEAASLADYLADVLSSPLAQPE